MTYWVFIDGKLLASGVDAGELAADRFFNLITHMYLDDNLQAEEYREARDKSRVAILKAYNMSETEERNQSGRSNDEAAGEIELDPFGNEIRPSTPLPELPVTTHDESGYHGLEAPLGEIIE